MSRENLELSYRAIDAFNRRDLDAYLALMDPAGEFTPYEVWVQGGSPHRGHAGIRSWWEESFAVVPDSMTKKSLLSPPAPNSISPGSRSRTLPSSRSRACCLASSRGKAHPAQRSSKRLPRSMGCREPWLRCASLAGTICAS
jgi:hypothetical protein